MLLDDCFRPLIGVIIFQPKYMLSLIKTDQYKFPSPYRGYHLSTFELPGKKAGFPGIVSVPLSGLSSFNYLRNSSFYLFQYVSVPLSGLSSFNSSIDIIYLILYMLCFRPLIGVIIFQQCMQVWMIMQQSFPSPYRGYHLSTLPPFSPYFIRLSRGFSVPKI